MTHCVHCLRPAATWFRVVSCIYFFFLEAGLTCIDSFLKLTTKIIGINLFLFVWYYPAQCKVLEIFSNFPPPPPLIFTQESLTLLKIIYNVKYADLLNKFESSYGKPW